MTSSLIISNYPTGYETDRTPFNVDNTAFPVLNNMYVWRGRMRKKRGTQQLGRLERTLTTVSIGASPASSTWTFSLFSLLNRSGAITAATQANPCQITSANHGLLTGQQVTITGVVGMTQLNGNTYTITFVNANAFTLNVNSTGFTAYVSGGTWTLIPPAIDSEANPQIVPGSVVITDGTDTFTDQGNGTLKRQDGNLTSTINYSTGAITLNRTISTAITFTATLSYYPCLPVMGIEDFDLNFNTSPGVTNFPTNVFFDTRYSYQYNAATASFYDVNFYKNTGVHFTWAGQNYQQFWATNYQGAMWATNSNPGISFKAISGVTHSNAGNANNIDTLTITGHGLTTSDYIFVNEVGGVTSAAPNGVFGGLNGLSGIVASVVDANHITIAAPYSTGAYTSGGIAQYLTRSLTGSQDGIKWYDGDPTTMGSTLGWVNFAPPLSNVGLTGGNPEYLVGAKVIIPFKGRLLFFGTWTQTSTGSPVYNPNQLIASQDGTAYYATPVPVNQTADPSSYYLNVVARGFQINAPIMQEIILVTVNRDVLICHYDNLPLKLYATGDDSLPFLYQTVSSEFGSQSTFSGVALDNGVLTVGPYGFTITSSENTERIDLNVIDQVYDITSANNGSQRVTAIRDYRNEFVYFTYPTNSRSYIYPTKTLLFNYRDQTWATFDENYTTYGTFRFTSKTTWATLPYRRWDAWTVPWNFGSTAQRYPYIAAGNQQGFVMLKQEGTYEDYSQFISAFNTSTLVITSPDHGLQNGDYIVMTGVVGVANANGLIYQIAVGDNVENTFTLLPTATQQTNTPISGTYLGGGTYKRLVNIFVQSKQFPILWDKGRKTRIGTQRYLIQNSDTDTNDDIPTITANVYVSQNGSIPTNDPLVSSYLIYTNVLLTGTEPAHPEQEDQSQIWHRVSNSFIGDTVQIGFQLSDAQMRDASSNQSEIEIHAIAFDLYPGPILA